MERGEIMYTCKHLPGREFKTIKEMCDAANVDAKKIWGFKAYHKEMTHGEILDMYLDFDCEDLRKIKCSHVNLGSVSYTARDTFRKKCEENNVNYKNAMNYRSRHKVSDEEAIQHFVELRNADMTICQAARVNNFNYYTFAKFARVRKNEGKKIDDIVEEYREELKKMPIASRCRELGLNPKAVYQYKRTHPNMSVDEVMARCARSVYGNKKDRETRYNEYFEYVKQFGITIEQFDYCVNKNEKLLECGKSSAKLRIESMLKAKENRDKRFDDFCESNGIEDEYVKELMLEFRQDNPLQTYSRSHSRAMKVINETEPTFSERCRENGLDYQNAYYLKTMNKDLSDSEVIELAKKKAKEKVEEFCKLYNVDIKEFIEYKNSIGPCTVEHAMINYMKDNGRDWGNSVRGRRIRKRRAISSEE